MVKRPIGAYIEFSKDRHASGDFRNMNIKEAAQLIGKEWKALSEAEKKVSCSEMELYECAQILTMEIAVSRHARC